MGYYAAIFLLLVIVVLFWVVQKGIINTQMLSILAGITTIGAFLAAVLTFVVPAAPPGTSAPNPTADNRTSRSEDTNDTQSSSPSPPPDTTPVPTDLPPPTATAVVNVHACPWSFQIYNVTNPDSLARVQLNGTTVTEVPDHNGLMQDTSWVDISQRLISDSENTVRFTVVNAEESSAGFRLLLGDDVVVDEQSSRAPDRYTFDKSVVLTPDCDFSPISQSGTTWEIDMAYDNWVVATFYVDGVEIGSGGGRYGLDTLDISPHILADQSHRITIRGQDSALMNGGGVMRIQMYKDGVMVFERRIGEFDDEFSEFHIRLLPDGRLEL